MPRHGPRSPLAPLRRTSAARLCALALVAAFAGLPGCAADSGTGSGGGGVRPASPATLAPALDAMCGLLDRCPDLPPVAARSRGECVDILYWLLTCRLVEEDDELVGTERVALDITETQARACAAFLDGLSCDELDCLGEGSCPDASACVGLFAGFGSDDDDDDVETAGGSCSTNSDCAAGLGCAPEAFDETVAASVCRVCVPLLGDGEACEPTNVQRNVRCRPELACIRDPQQTSRATCQPPRLDAEPCYESSDCASGFCAGDICSSAGREGDPCVEASECRWFDALTCIDGECSRRRPNGQPCSTWDHCLVLECDHDGLCGTALDGQCFDSQDCRSGYCLSRRCTAPLPDGQRCTLEAPEACESGYCDPETTLCAPARPPQPRGGLCTTATQCEEGLECTASSGSTGVCYRPCDETCPDGEFCDYTGSRTECRPVGEEGAGCDDDEECASGFCNDADRCAVRPQTGDPCTGFGDCYPRGACRNGVCVARAGPGEECSGWDGCLEPYLCLEGRCTLISLSCEPGRIGQQCTYLRFCADGAYCDSATLTCVERKSEGEECSGFSEECEAGLYCAFDVESGPECRPRLPVGSECFEPSQCLEGATCLGGTCEEAVGGERCDVHEDCPEGTFCSDDSDRCEPFRTAGQECDTWDVLCAPDHYCNDDWPRLCVVRPGLGEPCDNDTGCGPGTICDPLDPAGPRCVARAGLGEECTDRWDDPWQSDCREDLFCDDSTSPATCAQAVPLGESCTGSNECASGICDFDFYRCASTDLCVPPE